MKSIVLAACLLLTAAMPAYAALDATPARASVGRLLYISQTMNNCGPASVAEVLDYYGIHKTQGEVQAVLRADGNSGGMAPFGIPSYVRSLGMSALMGAGGTDSVIKALIANGFPVIVSQWVSLSDHYGHYRPIEAYDDARGAFVSSDPYLGPDHAISYAEFDAIWVNSNNRFYVIYPPDREAQLKNVLAASGWDPASSLMADIAIQQARLDGGQTVGPVGWGFRKGYSALSMAWDNLQLGDLVAARRALGFAQAQGPAPIMIRWIDDEITRAASAAA